jgi:hypothetical protein
MKIAHPINEQCATKGGTVNRLKRTWTVLTIFTGMLVPTLAAPVGAQHDDGLRQRLLQEAPEKLDDYLRGIKLLQGTFSWFGDKYHYDYQYKTNGIHQILVGPAINGGTQAHGTNARYAFKLHRKNDKMPWVIVDLLDLRTDKLSNFELIARGHLHQLALIDRALLRDALRDPAFRVTDCKPVQRDGEELVEVTFVWPQVPEKRKISYDSGIILLDPKCYWLLRSSDLETATRKTITRVKEWVKASNGLPMPRLVEIRIFDWKLNRLKKVEKTDKPTEFVDYLRFDLRIPDTLPDEKDFTLSAFGLQEPPWLDAPRPMPWFLWLAVIGIICLIGGVIIVRRKNRAAKTVA